ncbi:MAG: hypothetical protein ACNA8L_12750 [Luteolibacter sp.]
MKKTYIAFICILLIAIPGCIYEGGAGYPPRPGYPYGHSTSAYRSGYDRGVQDANSNRSRSVDRWLGNIRPSDRREFTRGYHAGYDRHLPSHGEARRHERRGGEAAQRDQRRGLSYNPSRHYGDVPRQFRNDFERGYRDAWRGRRR